MFIVGAVDILVLDYETYFDEIFDTLFGNKNWLMLVLDWNWCPVLEKVIAA